MLLRSVIGRRSRWSAAARLGATSALVVAIAVGLTAWLLVWQVETAMVHQGQSQLQINLKLARELLRGQDGDGPLRVENEQLVGANGHVIDGDMDVVDKVRAIAGGTATVFRGDMRVSTNVVKADGSRAIGTRLAPGPVHDSVLRDGQMYRGEADILGTRYFAVYDPIKDARGGVIGVLYVGVKKAEFLSLITAIARAAAVTGTALIVLGGGALLIAVRRTFRPLNVLRDAMTELAAGRLDTKVPALGRVDEIGRMAGAVQVFKDGLITARHIEAEKRAERAATERHQAAINQHTGDFGASISGVMVSLAAAAEAIRQSADIVSQSASSVHEQAGDTAAGAVESSQQLAAVAVAVGQMTASIESISRQVASAAEVARQAVCQAQQGEGSMKSLADATSRIGHVISLISSIAGQTNLLALNATIESARAGEAGKGFAVVAGEVKNLAAQTTKATEEIGGQIAAIQTATENAISAMSQIGGIIAKMEHVSSTIASAVEEQSATTRAIATSVQAVGLSLDTAARSMKQVVENADKAGAVGQTVLVGADEISQQASTLHAEVDQFLHAIRTDTNDRRNYERVDGNGMTATIAISGRPPETMQVKDISRSGIAVSCSWQVPAGTQAGITLAGARTPLGGRVARSEKGIMAILFRQDNATLEQVDRLLSVMRTARAA